MAVTQKDPVLFCVVMAGGAGTRFWPASTQKTPKQLLRFFGDRSLLQQSVDRARVLCPPERVLVVTSIDFCDAVRTQLPELPHDNIIAEPLRRDTAAAVALAALCVEQRAGRDAVMAILTADHKIEPADVFADDIRAAMAGACAQPGSLWTLGIPPTFPSTGFGYLELGAKTPVPGADAAAVVRFVEKPTLERAEHYVRSGSFLWNSGMFVWRVGAILDELERCLPEHLTTLRPTVAANLAGLAEAFSALTRISIDYGVMEKARDVRCVRARFSWSDVGGFPALAEHLPQQDDDNSARGRTVILDAFDNLVFCEDDTELVALLGVEGLIVVRAGKRTLVMPKGRAEDVKKIVALLAEEDR